MSRISAKNIYRLFWSSHEKFPFFQSFAIFSTYRYLKHHHHWCSSRIPGIWINSISYLKLVLHWDLFLVPSWTRRSWRQWYRTEDHTLRYKTFKTSDQFRLNNLMAFNQNQSQFFTSTCDPGGNVVVSQIVWVINTFIGYGCNTMTNESKSNYKKQCYDVGMNCCSFWDGKGDFIIFERLLMAGGCFH